MGVSLAEFSEHLHLMVVPPRRLELMLCCVVLEAERRRLLPRLTHTETVDLEDNTHDPPLDQQWWWTSATLPCWWWCRSAASSNQLITAHWTVHQRIFNCQPHLSDQMYCGKPLKWQKQSTWFCSHASVYMTFCGYPRLQRRGAQHYPGALEKRRGSFNGTNTAAVPQQSHMIEFCESFWLWKLIICYNWQIN